MKYLCMQYKHKCFLLSQVRFFLLVVWWRRGCCLKVKSKRLEKRKRHNGIKKYFYPSGSIPLIMQSLDAISAPPAIFQKRSMEKMVWEFRDEKTSHQLKQ